MSRFDYDILPDGLEPSDLPDFIFEDSLEPTDLLDVPPADDRETWTDEGYELDYEQAHPRTDEDYYRERPEA